MTLAPETAWRILAPTQIALVAGQAVDARQAGLAMPSGDPLGEPKQADDRPGCEAARPP